MKPGGSRQTAARGFTLIEVLVSMVVLSIGLVGSVAALGQSIRWSSQARKVTAAQLLGNEILERLRLEARFDGENGVPGAENSGLSKGGALDAANAWASDRLPYLSSDRVEASAGAQMATCNPAGAADGNDYGVGPFALRYEGNVYWVCYRIVAPAAGFPASSIGAFVKILWSGETGIAASHVSGLLAGGF